MGREREKRQTPAVRVVFEEGCGDFNVICMSVFWQCYNTHTHTQIYCCRLCICFGGSMVAVCKENMLLSLMASYGDEALDENTVYVCMLGLRMFA